MPSHPRRNEHLSLSNNIRMPRWFGDHETRLPKVSIWVKNSSIVRDMKKYRKKTIMYYSIDGGLFISVAVGAELFIYFMAG